MGLTAFNRARRRAARKAGLPMDGLSYTAAIAILRGSDSAEQPAKTPEPVAPEQPADPLLALFNAAQVAADLTELPTIGKVTAGKILKNRPESGYASFEEIQSLNADSTNVDWEQVRNHV